MDNTNHNLTGKHERLYEGKMIATKGEITINGN